MSGDSRKTFELRAGPFVKRELTVVSLTGREAISSLFSFEIVFLTDVDWLELSSAVLGQAATLVMQVQGRSPRIVQGIAAELELLGVRRQLRECRMRLVPRMWLLEKRKTSRVFQDMTVVEVVDAVLDGADVARRWSTSRPFLRRSYCLQYEETDYDFVRRVCAEDGVYFFFEPPSALLDEATGGMAEAVAGEVTAAAAAVGGVIGDAVTGLASAAHLVETVVFGNGPGAYLPIADRAGDEIVEDVIETVGDAVSSISEEGGSIVGSFAPLAHVPGPSVPYLERQEAHVHRDEAVHAFSLGLAVRSNAVELRDYDFQRPLLELVGRAGGGLGKTALSGVASLRAEDIAAIGSKLNPEALESDAVSAVTTAIGPRLAVYDHRGDYEEPDAADAMAAVHLEQHRARASRARGESTCRRLAPGYRFTLSGHVEAAMNQEYVVASVHHTGRTVEALRDDPEQRSVYENRFRCAPAHVALRPKRPPIRLQQVVETAVVVGPPSEEIHTDRFGRIRVHFHWDREGQDDDHSSCWIRLAQTWAGTGWGFQFIPRVGMEVLVTFVGGDVDRPMVIGCVSNATHPVPYLLPQNKARSGIRTQSTPGGTGYNELSFDDSSEREQVSLKAQKDLVEHVGQDHASTVGRNQSTTIASTQTETVGGERHDSVGGNESRSVKGHQSFNVGGDQLQAVDGRREDRVAGGVSTQLRGWRLANVGNQNWIVSGQSNTTVGTKAQETALNFLVYGAINQDASKVITLRSETGVALECGESSLTITKDEVAIRAKSIVVKAGSSLKMSGDGPSMQLAKDAMITSDTIKLMSKGGALELDQDRAHVSGPSLALNTDPSPPPPAPEKGKPPRTRPIKVKMLDVDLVPYKKKTYTLVTQGFKCRGETDGEGVIQQDVPAQAVSAQVTLWTQTFPEGERLDYTIALGDLPDADSAAGAEKRLTNLGYYAGPPCKEVTPELREALLAFQLDHGLSPTGELDGPTKAKLGEVHP